MNSQSYCVIFIFVTSQSSIEIPSQRPRYLAARIVRQEHHAVHGI